ncbi:MAG: DsbA family protein, partial [Acidobacteriota bacterium]
MDFVKIRVYYDFASTLCYVAHRVITRVQNEITAEGIELEWRPVDLTMAAPWDRGDSFNDEVRESVRETALSLGVDIEMPDPWLDSRPASEIALATVNLKDEARWRSAVFDTFFEAKTPRLTPQLRERAGERAPPDVLAAAPQMYGRVELSTEEAMALGVTGVPTFLLDNWVFGGVYDDESMVAALTQL